MRIVCIALMFFAGNAWAQYEYHKICVESNERGWAHCRLKPDYFGDWSYSTGYGVKPTEVIDGKYGYRTEDEAAFEALQYLVYKNPNFSSMCQISFYLGEEEVVERDSFSLSREKIKTSKHQNLFTIPTDGLVAKGVRILA